VHPSGEIVRFGRAKITDITSKNQPGTPPQTQDFRRYDGPEFCDLAHLMGIFRAYEFHSD
jgi:hypothetical protein